MATVWTIKSGSLQVPFSATVQDENGAAVDLSAASANLVVYVASDDIRELALTCGADGTVTHEWAEADVPDPGTYRAEIQGTLADSTPFRIPTEGYLSLRVTPALQ